MRIPRPGVLFVPLFLLAVAPVCAGDKPAGKSGAQPAETPTIVIRVQSLDALLQNLNLVVKLVGQEEAASQIEGLVKSKIGKQGLEGVDPARPFGAYVRFGKAIDDITGALLIPIIDQEAFLALLEKVGVPFTKDKDDIYTHKTNKNFNLYFRFAHRYLYITSVNTESIQDKKLLDPAQALALSGKATISLVARVDQIPNDAKLIALAQLEETILAAQKKRQPGETKIQEEFRSALLREANKLGSSLIREAAELRFDLDVSDKTKEISVHLAVTGKPNSDLARVIKNLGTLQSPLVGLASKEAAFQGAVHLVLPETLNKALGSLIDEVAEKSVEGIQSEPKKKQAEALFKAMLPTAKAGEFQIVAAVFGPQEKHFSFVTALKLKDGLKLGKTVQDLLKDALDDIPANLREKIQLDFESVGAVKIHRFEIPKNAKMDRLIEEVLGAPHLYLAFRDDAVFLALGHDALASLKNALSRKDSVSSQPLVFDFDAARMAPLMTQTQEQKDLAGKLFAEGQNGRVRLVLEGGSQLTARLQMRLSVLEFLVKMKNAKQGPTP